MDRRLAAALSRIVAAVSALRVRAEEADRAIGHDLDAAIRKEQAVRRLEKVADRLEAAL